MKTMINSSLNADYTKIWVTLDNPGGREINKMESKSLQSSVSKTPKIFELEISFSQKKF